MKKWLIGIILSFIVIMIAYETRGYLAVGGEVFLIIGIFYVIWRSKKWRNLKG